MRRPCVTIRRHPLSRETGVVAVITHAERPQLRFPEGPVGTGGPPEGRLLEEGFEVSVLDRGRSFGRL